MKKVSNRLYLLKKTLDYTGVFILLMILFALWQLYKGPISVPFLKPYIIQALNYDENNTVSVDEVNIELVRSVRPIKIIAKNVKYRSSNEDISIEAPDVSVSFSIRALMRGMIAPSRIAVENPKLYIFTTYGIDKEKVEDTNKLKMAYYADMFEQFVEHFNSEDKLYPESYINDIVVTGAEVEFHEVDFGRKWNFSDLNYTFSRKFTNMETKLDTLVNMQDRVSAFGLEAAYQPSEKKISYQTYFSELYFSDLAENIAPAEIGYKFDIPVSARFEGTIDFAAILANKDNVAKAINESVGNISFRVEGGNGSVKFSDDETMNYPVNDFVLNGQVEGGLQKIVINDANFDLDGEKIKISLEAKGLQKYFIEKSPKDIQIKLRTDISRFSLSKLSVYWPRYIAEKAWEWCKDSIYGGLAKNAYFEFLFKYNDSKKEVTFADLKGKVEIEDSNIDYLGELPVVKNFYGTADFSNDSIYIKVDKGVADGVIVSDGFVHLYDLGSEHNMIKIRLIGNSSIKDALNFIDHKPLDFAKDLGINPQKVSGDVDVNLVLAFELKSDITNKDVGVEVTADLHNLEIADIADKKPLKAEKLELVVDNNGFRLFGNAVFDEIPLQLNLSEDFHSAKYKSKYDVSFKFDDFVKKKFGIDFDILGGDYASGYADVNASVLVYDNKKADIEVEADLQNMRMNYGFFGFVKTLKEPARLSAKISAKNGKITKVDKFELAKTDFSMVGNISVDAKTSKITTIDISKIKSPKMNAKAKIELKTKPTNKVVVNISGYSYDLTELFAKHSKLQSNSEQIATVKNSDWEDGISTDIDVFAAVSNLWTNPEVQIKNFSGSVNIRKKIGINEAHISGNYGNNQDIKMRLDYTPKQNREHILSIDSNNAGTTLKVFGLYDYMRGGNLKIEARRDKNKNFYGHAQIRNFSIQNTPLMAKLLTVASFSGLVNMLTGEGIAFTHFDAPFEYRNKILFIDKATAVGNVLGMSGSGMYNTKYQELNIKGVIAPAYSLNTMLGKIPLVGNLLSGKDGTVFAANYSIKGNLSSPDININPLSALSPNSIKELFGEVFGK